MGISLTGVTVIFPGKGANLELAISGPIPCFHAGAGAGAAATGAGAAAALGAGGGAVAHPCRIISDEASVESVANEISRCFMVISLLFLNTFYSNCGFFNLIPFERNAYSCRLGFCLRYHSSIHPKGHFLMKLIARLSADHPISGGGGFIRAKEKLVYDHRTNVRAIKYIVKPKEL
jgi:hypothetical protein